MKKRNVTIVIGEDIYLRARVWAAQRGSSLSEVVRVLLESVPTMVSAQRIFPVVGLSPHDGPKRSASQMPTRPAPTQPTPANQASQT